MCTSCRGRSAKKVPLGSKYGCSWEGVPSPPTRGRGSERPRVRYGNRSCPAGQEVVSQEDDPRAVDVQTEGVGTRRTSVVSVYNSTACFDRYNNTNFMNPSWRNRLTGTSLCTFDKGETFPLCTHPVRTTTPRRTGSAGKGSGGEDFASVTCKVDYPDPGTLRVPRPPSAQARTLVDGVPGVDTSHWT